jgi:DNA-binding CsgD family transcriptional regulator
MARSALTPREREVLALMAAGKTNADISRELGISFPTAKAHVSSVLAKLGVESREEAAKAASPPGRWRALVAAPIALVLGAAGVAAGVVLVVRAFASDESIQPEVLEVPLSALADGQPHHYDLEDFGESPNGTPYGAWVTLQPDGSITAFFDRDPHTGCAVPWKADQEFGDWYRVTSVDRAPQAEEYVARQTGAYRDGCGGWMYAKDDARKVFGAPARGLDGFPVDVRGGTAVVDLTSVILGLCSEPAHSGDCSRPGEPRTVSAPPEPAIPEWGKPSRR